MTRIDRDPPEADSPFANTGQLGPAEAPLLESPTGRSPSTETGQEDSVENDEITEKSVGTRPVDDQTDFHLSGTGAIETDDGLDETSEMVREMAEDTTDDQPTEARADLPVFDRGF
jgi:hypothetical protein